MVDLKHLVSWVKVQSKTNHNILRIKFHATRVKAQWLNNPECLKKPRFDRERGPKDLSGVREVEWARGRWGVVPGDGEVQTTAAPPPWTGTATPGLLLLLPGRSPALAGEALGEAEIEEGCLFEAPPP